MTDQPNKFIWFFRLRNGGNQCQAYNTDSEDEACQLLMTEYGEEAIAAVRRELTHAEYAGLLRCNFGQRGGYGEKVYAAIQDCFFRFDPREIANGNE